MPRILVTAAFKFAVDGLHVIEVEPGEQDVSERCAEVAVEHLQVASRLDGSQPAAVASAAPDKPLSPAKAPAKPKAKPGGAA
jgi:hypothetical protein